MFVEGYTDQLSYRAGEQVRLHVSTSADQYALEVTRIGAEREVVWRQDQLPGSSHPVPEDALFQRLRLADFPLLGSAGRLAQRVLRVCAAHRGSRRQVRAAGAAHGREPRLFHRPPGWPHGRPRPPPVSHQYLQRLQQLGRLQLLQLITAAAACRGIASPSTVHWPGCSTAGSATLSSGRRVLDTRSTTAPIPTSNGIPNCWTTTD